MRKALDFCLPGFDSSTLVDDSVESDEDNDDISSEESETQDDLHDQLASNHSSCFLHTIQRASRLPKLISKPVKIVPYDSVIHKSTDILGREACTVYNTNKVELWNKNDKISFVYIPVDNLRQLDTSTLSS